MSKITAGELLSVWYSDTRVKLRLENRWSRNRNGMFLYSAISVYSCSETMGFDESSPDSALAKLTTIALIVWSHDDLIIGGRMF